MSRRIPQGSWVLVTGANGFIGSQVVDVLLQEGYNVRGTVRSDRPWLNEYFDKKYGSGRFETAVVENLATEAPFDGIMNGIAGIVHVASDVSFNPDPNTVIPAVVKMTENFLEAAAKHPSVKSVVLTSSSTAAIVPKTNEKGVVVTENTWNDAAVAAAWNKDTPKDVMAPVVYAASKTEGERAMWKWVKENKPSFATNAVLPNLNFGKILTPQIPGSTMGWAASLLDGVTGYSMDVIPPQYYIDVRDTARLHVAALLDPKVENERLFAFAGQFNWTDVLEIMHKLRPDNNKLPKAPENEGRDYSDLSGPSARAEKLLQEFFGVKGWVSLEQSIADGVAGHA